MKFARPDFPRVPVGREGEIVPLSAIGVKAMAGSLEGRYLRGLLAIGAHVPSLGATMIPTQVPLIFHILLNIGVTRSHDLSMKAIAGSWYHRQASPANAAPAAF